MTIPDKRPHLIGIGVLLMAAATVMAVEVSPRPDTEAQIKYRHIPAAAPGFAWRGYVAPAPAGGMKLEWSGSGMDVRFKSATARLRFHAPSNSQYWIKVDDGAFVCYPVQPVIDLSPVLKPAKGNIHRLVLIKKTEPPNGVDLLDGMEIDQGGSVLTPSPDWPSRRILFLGDSITVGMQCPKSGETDVMGTYAWLLGAKFNADIRMVAVSGVGVFKGWRNQPFADEWNRVMSDVAAGNTAIPSSWQPDLIVFNLGTNDASREVKETDFQPAMKRLVVTVTGRYPKAAILVLVPWTYGCYPAALQTVVNQVHAELGATIKLVPAGPQGWVVAGGMSDNTHPNLKGHQVAAQKLLPFIANIMNWRDGN